MKQFSNRNSPRGFTLIELMVITAIIGLITATLVTNVIGTKKGARDSQRKHNFVQMQTALQAYYEDNGRFPDADNQHQIDGAPWGSPWQPYMARVPKDPLGTPQPQYYYEVDGNKSWYRLYARLERCQEDAQITIPRSDCETEDYNYAVASSNIAVE